MLFAKTHTHPSGVTGPRLPGKEEKCICLLIASLETKITAIEAVQNHRRITDIAVAKQKSNGTRGRLAHGSFLKP